MNGKSWMECIDASFDDNYKLHFKRMSISLYLSIALQPSVGR
jgi:hypothetical protein